jgi:hypothetical protein
MVKDENSFFNEDIEAASGYNSSGDIGVFGFVEHQGNYICSPFPQPLPQVLFKISLYLYIPLSTTQLEFPQITSVDSGAVS